MNQVEQLKETLKTELIQAVVRAELADEAAVPDVVIETPKEKAHGDFATNLAMQLASVAKKAPKMIAEDIVAHLDYSAAGVDKIDVAGPGFINFFMKKAYLTDIVMTVLDLQERFGETTAGEGKKVQVEFVSANPTGTLHLGHARGAAVGDSLCNVLAKAGYDVSREYYINDGGNQIDNLTYSLEARYLQELGLDWPMPEDGYQGEDIKVIAEELTAAYGDRFKDVDNEARRAFLREFGLKRMIDKLKADLADFRVHFDSWFSESSLYENGKIEDVLKQLDENDKTYDADGATWFKSSEYGDDKDRVLVKNDGTYTYLTPDIAYHRDKFSRGFDELINIWGADHHGYIPRMKAAVQALGYQEDQLKVEIIQMVNLFENGEKVKMSKRTGNAVTMRDLMEEVGIDATRYFFAMRAPDTHLDFDLGLAKSESNENPVYYVQYAHARLCTMLRQGKAKGVEPDQAANLELLISEKEQDLMKKVGEFPEVVTDSANKRAPHRITNYVYELAQALHSFYNAHKVLTDDEELSRARITLVEAVRITLKNALDLVGVDAPEKM
ncbi:arginine--tRNA ligase [Salisediminibacterium halotolerans]|uniref:arginine--tRNA ligase n=1 Tax=Salisediminibacterium halotolerans TaxID=517425 RepID=UPI000EB02C49|nr:arginine--tRNA ligase [Salisediminibacterium halotolerans]RLJ69635.1 arginyl-tRNA synthetase [Actinophytocola xinjiangensis]RPE89693.1 arginyl-tRNA synthetase [Salisediminibacterium halotolerans]TWG32529.1 arginyl-tRNA synthetase [Salisediminibacterium halotolerans]GEL09070.1 arginine--tRNA ligase [Salisediminibacterium halotolerans]